MEVILKKDTIGGQEVLVSADSYGRFTVYIDGETIHVPGDIIERSDGQQMTRLEDGRSMSDALDRAKAVVAKRRVRVQVPFISRTGEHGIATGIHAGTRAVLASIGGANGVQLASTPETSVFPGDADPDLVAEYIAEQQKKRDAETRIFHIERDHFVRLYDEVDAAITETIEKQYASAVDDPRRD